MFGHLKFTGTPEKDDEMQLKFWFILDSMGSMNLEFSTKEEI